MRKNYNKSGKQTSDKQTSNKQASNKQASGKQTSGKQTSGRQASGRQARGGLQDSVRGRGGIGGAHGMPAEGFADKYFNYDLAGAAGLCTPESGKWIAFAASNVTQEDVDMLNAREESAECSAETVELTGDSTATAECRVENFLRPDTLGRPAEMTGEAVYAISLVKRNGRWLVKMEGLPQSGRRSRD